MQKLCLALATTSLIVGFSTGVISEPATRHQEDRYAPMRFAIPDTIGEYAVLAILTEDNFVCMTPGEKRLVLRSSQPAIDSALRGFPKERSEWAQWEASIVGPGLTREQLVSHLDRLYRSFNMHGCALLQLPDATNCSGTDGGECKGSKPGPGLAVIQNTNINNLCPANAQSPCSVNGQSVILVAPVVGHNQGGILSEPISEIGGNLVECVSIIPRYCKPHPGYSAFLNNGITDEGYFLQVGLYFTNKATVKEGGKVFPGDQDCQAPAGCYGDGLVVWAGSKTKGGQKRDLQGRSLFKASADAQPAAIPYISGHHYYTTVTYTSGVWWTCAADVADTSTYQCQNHPDAEGDHLVENANGTNVFVEVWNQNRDWAGGFTVQWPAYEARTYVDGLPHPWKTQAVWSVNSCPDAWPPNKAVVGSLVPDGRQFNDGWAFFNADGYIPPFCF